jgi:hypothetical protein
MQIFCHVFVFLNKLVAAVFFCFINLKMEIKLDGKGLNPPEIIDFEVRGPELTA